MTNHWFVPALRILLVQIWVAKSFQDLPTSECILGFDAGLLADPVIDDQRLPGLAGDWAAVSTRRGKPLHGTSPEPISSGRFAQPAIRAP